jgi:uncharacterized membrane protein YhdT
MSAFDNKESKRNAIILMVLVVVIILIISFFLGGANGLFGIIRFFMSLMLFVGFITLIVFVVYFIFFKKHRRDIPFENWKDYKKSALQNGADLMDELILVGDKHHSAKRFMTIKGYLRVMNFSGEEYDMFVGKRSSINPFEEHKIVMLKPDHHSDLIGDVYVKGISLIQKYGYYWLNSQMLEFQSIDMNVAMDTYRTLMYDTLGDMKQVVNRAIGIDPDFRREQLAQKLLKIPSLQGDNNNGNQE